MTESVTPAGEAHLAAVRDARSIADLPPAFWDWLSLQIGGPEFAKLSRRHRDILFLALALSAELGPYGEH